MQPDTLSVSALIEKWRKPRGFRAAVAACFVLLLIGAVGGLVYYSGGTVFVWPHLMYVPLILAAAVFRIPGGIIAAFICGLVLGPLMPLSVAKEIPQQTANWLFRIFFFLLVGLLTGLISQWFNEQIDRAQRQSLHDPLTGLPNFLSLQNFLLQALSNGGRPDSPVALAVINISNLSQIIDTLSYRSASKLCLQIAERLQNSSSPSLSFYKMQSNTYACSATDIDLHEFINLCRGITKNLKEPFHFEGIPVIVNMHLGITRTENKMTDADEMIQKASIAAHAAEDQNLLYSTYSKNIDTNCVKRLSLLGTMKDALEAEELILFLQPKVAISSGKIVGAEALIRWQHPEDGLLSPNLFIPEAEKTWLIHPLSLFAIRAGLNQLRRWKNDGYDLKLAINLTSHNIQDRSLITELINMVRDYDIDASNLEIEITERSLVTDMRTASEVLTSLKSIGTQISIDDFGTGYSSARYLKKLPIDAVKIDQSLIADLPSSPFSRSLVKHILGAAGDLELKTVAEGVESKELFELLGEMGCDIAQGYYISKPLAEKDFDRWLQNSSWTVNSKKR